MYKRLVRPFLFLFSPEKAHAVSVSLFKLLLLIPGIDGIFRWYSNGFERSLRFDKKGLRFPNRVGLAAGFDKNATFYKAFRHLGFGFIEVGTVTPVGQPGNPKPRLFRLPQDEAIINRMGFNNEGVEAMVKRLKNRPKGLIVGGNIGKNKLTPNEKAVDDYLICFRALQPYVDYYAVNVSSPNTPGLRDLQEKEPLKALLKALQEEARHLKADQPILLKIAPDLTESELSDIVEIVQECELAGVIATNTTVSRAGLKTSAELLAAVGAGGLSGKPVRDRSSEVIRYLREHLGPEPLIIGVGGIHTAEAALEKIDAGADLIQVYTGFIYEGPALIRSIHQQLEQRTQ